MAIFNNTVITPGVRLNMNKGFAESRYDLLGSQTDFDKTIACLSDWLGVGRETVLRWYGFQRGATNRIVPKIAEGFTPRNLADETSDITDPFTGEELTEEKRERLRIRVLIASLVGHTSGSGVEPEEIGWGLWREPLWTGKKRIYEKYFDNIRDAVSYAYAVWVGEDAYSGGQEGAYLNRAWYHMQLSFIPASSSWGLDIYCRDRGRSGDPDPGTGLPSLDESDAEETPTDEDGEPIE